jgi:molybdenum cofactor cytidylyltransferase
MGKTAIAILAAGRGSRFGEEYKLLTLLNGRSLFRYALDSAFESGLSPIILVVGYKYEEIIKNVPDGVTIIYNEQWEKGISSSVKAALNVLELEKDITAVCIGLADQPYISAKVYKKLANIITEHEKYLGVATYYNQRKNPVLIPRTLWQEIAQLTGDMGAKQLMQKYPVIEVKCDGIGNAFDIDTKEDLQISYQ